MRTGILAKKLGMTSFFNEDGSKFPATLLYVEDCEVTDIRNIEKNNYNAVQLGIINVNQNKINKPQKISFAKSKTKAKKHFFYPKLLHSRLIPGSVLFWNRHCAINY